ncbi:MAG: tetratricopeptide repeat protein [Bdellovibrionales bacterium]|nr:tetratricopeptide repeat protein [Bdellovibrionales bacterium]
MKKKSLLPNNCPQCGSSKLDRENAFGKIECQNCFWLGDVSDYVEHPPADWRRWSKKVYLATLLGFVTFMGIQLALWQRFSVDVTWIFLKRVTWQADVNDWLDMGAICNSLGKFSCSVNAFSQVLYRQPRNRTALANLAIAHSQLSDWKQAQKYFEAYFSLGGEAFDTMFWYARTLVHLNDRQRGLEWYYKALILKPDLLEVSSELVDQLMAMEFFEEALAFVGHISAGKPERDVFWGQKVVSLNSFMQEHEAGRAEGSLAEFRVPSLTGSDYYLPVWTEERGNVQFALVDGEVDESIFPRYAVDIRLIEKVMETEKLKTDDEVKEVEIPRLRIGPWWFSNVKVTLCENCQLRLGRDLLDELNMEEETRFDIDFLAFSR